MSKIICRFREITRNAFKRYSQVNEYKRTPLIMGVQTLNVFRSRPQNFGVITMLALFWPLSKEKKTNESDISAADKRIIAEGLKEADQLYDNGQYNDCYDFLSKLYKQYNNDVEILWRKARAIYQLASQPVIDDKYKAVLANNAFSTITKAMAADENNFAVHKWMAVILDLKCSCESTKERVKHLEVVKKHMLRAIELNPNDATTLYMLGEWCYRIADMPWYQRKIASTLFATPPTSTFDEAIEYFSRAEVVEPRFYSMNLLMLGKTYLKLGKEDIGKYYLNLALLYPARSNDDHQANKEAQDILKRFNVLGQDRGCDASSNVCEVFETSVHTSCQS